MVVTGGKKQRARGKGCRKKEGQRGHHPGTFSKVRLQRHTGKRSFNTNRDKNKVTLEEGYHTINVKGKKKSLRCVEVRPVGKKKKPKEPRQEGGEKMSTQKRLNKSRTV